jgi:hypothetical protein
MHNFKFGHLLGLIIASSLVMGGAFAAQDSIPVSESLDVHFEASDGTQGPAQVVRLVMVNPPLGLEQLNIKSDLSPLFFSADCKKNQVRVHDQESLVDSGWETVQSGSFELNLASPSLAFEDDGRGHGNCHADVNLHVRGKLDCHNPNAPGLSAEIAYQLSGDQRSRGAWTSCSFPRDAYLYGHI